MQSSVCPRASERISAGIVFRGKYLRGEPTPSRLRWHCAASLTPFLCQITYYYLDRTLAVAAGMRLRGPAPAAIEQDGGGLHTHGVLVAVSHDGRNHARCLVGVRPRQRLKVDGFFLVWQ